MNMHLIIQFKRFVVQDVVPYLTWDKVGKLEVGAAGEGGESQNLNWISVSNREKWWDVGDILVSF